MEEFTLKAQKIYIGSWFQRTTLHLSEMYDFFKNVESPLKLDKNKLNALHAKLKLIDVEDVADELEFIHLRCKEGIEVKIYEDGLIVVSKDPTKDTHADIKHIAEYYEQALSPSLSYIFSLGAPIPKELANIKTVYPYFIILDNSTKGDILKLLKNFDQEVHNLIIKETFEVYRGDKLYIINSLSEPLKNIEQFVGEQIFIREFKAQLHHYLNLHRVIWQNIAEIKERGKIKGKEIAGLKTKIEAYEKSVTLIDTRINQMGTYLTTRGAIAKNSPEMNKFIDVLHYKHETLNDTLSYIKEIWKMTRAYVSSSIAIFADLQSQATTRSLQNLTIVTSMGVGVTLIGLFTKESLPTFTWFGLGYFLVLALIGYSINRMIKQIYLNRDYTISTIEADKNIK